MAVYGIDIYGLSRYGTNAVVDYDIQPFTAHSTEYGIVEITWKNADGTWDDFRLLKSRKGYPITENDGEILYSQEEPSATLFLDTNPAPGTYAYYAIYLHVDDAWVRAGVTSCLIIESFDSLNWMMERLPEYFITNVGGDLTEDVVGNAYVHQFLSVFSWGLDELKTQYKLASKVNDTESINIQSLQGLSATLGVPFDPEVSGNVMRLRIKSSSVIAREKGTLSGWRNLINVMTGFDADVTTGRNLLLDDDQSGFVHPVYPDWSPLINYAEDERVRFNHRWYEANAGGAYGTAQAPSNDGSPNTWWTMVSEDLDSDGTVLLNSKTGGISTWEALTFSGVTLEELRVRLSFGVQSPFDPDVTAANALYVSNASASVGDIGVRSVSRVRRQLTKLNAAINNSTTTIVVKSIAGLPTSYPFIIWVDWDNPATAEAIKITQAATGTGPYTYANCVRAASSTTAVSHDALSLVYFDDTTMDPEQPILDGIPVPWIRDSQEWDQDKEYSTGDMALFANRPYVALRASTGVEPPYPDWDTPSHEWAAVGFDRRVALMLSGYTHQPNTFTQFYQAQVYPFIEWYDATGKIIDTIYAKSPYYGHPNVRAATTAALPNTPAYDGGTLHLTSSTQSLLSIDGLTFSLNQRILVKNQADAKQNGVYKVLNPGANGSAFWVLERDFDGDASADFVVGSTFYVESGTTNAGTRWYMTNTTVPTLDTNNITYATNPYPWETAGIYFDSFSDEWGSSNLNGRSLDIGSGSWTEAVSTWNVDGFRGGSVYPTTAGTRAVALVTGPANGQLSVTVRTEVTAGMAQGIVFRYSTDNNYWRADRTSLRKKVAGVWTTVDTYDSDLEDNDRLTVVLNGSSITVKRNGVTVATATDAFNSSATQHGLIVENV